MRHLKDYKKGGTCYDCKNIRLDDDGYAVCIKKNGSFFMQKKTPKLIQVRKKRNDGFLMEAKCKDDFEAKG